ncbi:xyloglucan O-acetyltransferase 4 [Euphorbia lathyris]|uniref:xyloglucan O-acetyltransferase 4 n=1 Tax=Euphorbia lathyris TaxID=212925 RepID=UPI003313B268
MEKLVPLMFSCLGFSLFLLYSPNPFNHFHHHNPNLEEDNEKCDFFRGNWVPEVNGVIRYTNSSCATIPESKNCFRNGRQDTDFLNWRWKPDKCDLPSFDSREFLDIVRGKIMAFVGDSVARNHVESLLCLLSQEEVPIDVYKDAQDRNRIWHFPSYDFTLKILWTKFLVSGEERMINGSSSGVFDLYLDKVDNSWSRAINNIDYIIISAGHWLFRPIYLHKDRKVIACVYCNEPNITDRGVNFAVRMIFRAALNRINSCKKCKGSVTLLRTFSPSHFEDGFWNTGGSCNRTSPFGKSKIDLTSREWELRTMQVEELERVNKIQRGKKFEALDVTRAMLMRPDGHPGAYWGNKWMKGYNDCVHWCLPGPIDLWNDMLLALLRKRLFT